MTGFSRLDPLMEIGPMTWKVNRIDPQLERLLRESRKDSPVDISELRWTKPWEGDARHVSRLGKIRDWFFAVHIMGKSRPFTVWSAMGLTAEEFTGWELSETYELWNEALGAGTALIHGLVSSYIKDGKLPDNPAKTPVVQDGMQRYQIRQALVEGEASHNHTFGHGKSQRAA